jgi:hypothetical protein
MLAKTTTLMQIREKETISYTKKLLNFMIRIRSYVILLYFLVEMNNKSNGLRVVLEIGFFHFYFFGFLVVLALVYILALYILGDGEWQKLFSQFITVINLKSLFTFGELCTPMFVVCPKAIYFMAPVRHRQVVI